MTTCLAVVPARVSTASAGDGIAAYISPPFVQGPPSSFVAMTDDFNSASSCTLPRTNSFGTFSGSCTSVNSGNGDHIFGGASTTSDEPTVGGTASTFVAAWGAPTQVLSMTFTVPARYVGFWWSAGSAGNQVKLYAADNSTLLATFTTDNINSLLNTSGNTEPSVLPPPVNQYPGSQVVTALDGSDYLKGYYFGRPADHTTLTPTGLPRGVTGSSYNINLNIYSHAYLNVYASGSITFGKAEFIGGGFELDNLAISTSQQTPPSNQVLLQSVLGETVDFRGNGGTGSMTPQTSTSSRTLSANAFTRTGYTFAGWNTAANGSGTPYADLASYPFTASTTLYAQWTADTLTVMYDSQSGSVISNGSTTTGAAMGSPGTPTRERYVFAGWSLSPSGSTVSFPFAHGQTANFTLYAQWTADLSTVTFNANGGSGLMTAQTASSATNLTANSLTRTGYTFAGWNTAANGLGTPYANSESYLFSASTTLYAQWTTNPPVDSPPVENPVVASFAAIFDANGGSGSMSVQTASSATNLMANGFTRNGFTFSGWNTAANGSGTAYANSESYPFASDLTLYAQWTADTLTVSTDEQGGSEIGNVSTTTGGQITSSPGAPTRAGYMFDGWFAAASGGSVISFPYTHGHTTNFTLYAQWRRLPTFNALSGVARPNTSVGLVASSGDFTVTLSSPTPSVCRVVVSSVVFAAPGACRVQASADGADVHSFAVLVVSERKAGATKPRSTDVTELTRPLNIRIVYFAPDSAALSTATRRELRKLLDKLRRSGAVTVTGHAADDGDPEDDVALGLSQRRTQAVRDFFAARGVEVTAERAQGKKLPVSQNRTLNRRVEIAWYALGD